MAKLAHSAGAPTQFRFLNRRAETLLGLINDEDSKLETFLRTLKDSPEGYTPLCGRIEEVTKEILKIESQLRANRQKAAVIIATDGEPTDGNLFKAIKPLTQLPVSIIVRLCTDEQSIVDYWNKIDKDLELTLEVIDDYQSEAKEIHNYNPWLTYGYPMHELRGFGVYSKSFDLLDEQKLSSRQMIDVSMEMYIYNLLTFFLLFFFYKFVWYFKQHKF